MHYGLLLKLPRDTPPCAARMHVALLAAGAALWEATVPACGHYVRAPGAWHLAGTSRQACGILDLTHCGSCPRPMLTGGLVAGAASTGLLMDGMVHRAI